MVQDLQGPVHESVCALWGAFAPGGSRSGVARTGTRRMDLVEMCAIQCSEVPGHNVRADRGPMAGADVERDHLVAASLSSSCETLRAAKKLKDAHVLSLGS